MRDGQVGGETMPRYRVSDVWAYFGVIKALLKLVQFIESLIAIMMVSSTSSIWKKQNGQGTL